MILSKCSGASSQWLHASVLVASFSWAGCSSNNKEGASTICEQGSSCDSVLPEGSSEENSPQSVCIKKPEPDLPDDKFEDSNCDGIDGDKSKAIFVVPKEKAKPVVAAPDAGTRDGSMYGPIFQHNHNPIDVNIFNNIADIAEDLGSPENPFHHLGAAITKAIAANKDVYVCNGTYAENLVLTGGVHVYGGYDCTKGWKRSSNRATVAPVSGVVLTVKNIDKPVQFDRIAFKAPDATEPGSSSVAAWVVNSPEVSFSNAVLQSGVGAEGKKFQPPAQVTARATKGTDGVSSPPGECYTHWVDSAFYTSPSDTTFGCIFPGLGGGNTHGSACEGQGGRGGFGRGLNDITKRIDITTLVGTLPSIQEATQGFSGENGGPPEYGGDLTTSPKIGTTGAPGEPAKTGMGTLTFAGYQATNEGSVGAVGGPGGGGVGGFGGGAGVFLSANRSFDAYDGYEQFDRFFTGGGGGQGGFGGCGGAGGKGGGGGGASVALLAWDSPVHLTQTILNTNSGGIGGAPTTGAPGQPGGEPGAGSSGTANPVVTYPVTYYGVHDSLSTQADSHGKPGQPGAQGGHGGPGGAGGGGPSIGILAHKFKPILDHVTPNIGSGGKGGQGIEGSENGVNGESHEILVLEPVP